MQQYFNSEREVRKGMTEKVKQMQQDKEKIPNGGRGFRMDE